MKLAKFLKQAASVLNRLDALLPPETAEPDWQALAYRWQSVGRRGVLESLPRPHTFALSRLAAVDTQMQRLIRNTEQFLEGRPANNVLMTGARGTGKSSLVKALLHEYAERGLRLIEVDKTDLVSLPALLTILEKRPEKFIVFCDDLSFESGEDTYKALKTALDGGLSQRCANVLVYATSNRRHLMPEYMDENLATTGQRGEVGDGSWKDSALNGVMSILGLAAPGAGLLTSAAGAAATSSAPGFGGLLNNMATQAGYSQTGETPGGGSYGDTRGTATSQTAAPGQAESTLDENYRYDPTKYQFKDGTRAATPWSYN